MQESYMYSNNRMYLPIQMMIHLFILSPSTIKLRLLVYFRLRSEIMITYIL